MLAPIRLTNAGSCPSRQRDCVATAARSAETKGTALFLPVLPTPLRGYCCAVRQNERQLPCGSGEPQGEGMPLHFIAQWKVVSTLLSNSTHGERGSAGPLRSQGSWTDQCLRSPIPPKGDCMNKNTEATPWLPRRELRVGDGRGEVGGGSRVCEPDDRTVDVDSCGAIGSGPTCGRVEARQQIGAGGRQVEDDDLIDLPRVEPRVDGLLRPQAELRVPQWAVRLGMPGVGQGGEIPEHIEQVAPIAQGVDQGRIPGRGVLAGMPVAHQEHKPLGLRVVSARLPVDEAEWPLAL